MAKWARPPKPCCSSAAVGSRWSATLLLLCAGWLTGCGEIGLGRWIERSNGIGAQGRSIGTEEANDTAGPDSVPARLAGKHSSEVRSILGQPLGRLWTQSGSIWLYSDWRVELDAEGKVTAIEAERPVTVAGGRSAEEPPPVPSVSVVSQGGREIDLRSMLPPNKVAIVDFYADWCGPCRQISPHLEELANSDPEVVLVKVDIVKWGTPVTRQHQIRSIPNIRVYNRQKVMIGNPTSDLAAVRRYVEIAKKK